MDITSMLNNEPANKDGRAQNSHNDSARPITNQQGRHPSLPDIQTGYQGGPPPLTSPYHRHPSHSSLQSSAPYSATPSSGRFPQYQKGPLPSPHATSTPTSHYAPSYPSPGYGPLSHSPAPVQDMHQTPTSGSPIMNRHQAHPILHPPSSAYGHAATTPDPPRSAASRGSLFSSRDSPDHQRRSSVTSHGSASQNVMFAPGSHPPSRQATYPPLQQTQPNGNQGDKIGPGHYGQTQRHQSLSVSPKTILTSLPSQEASYSEQSRERPSDSSLARASDDSSERPSSHGYLHQDVIRPLSNHSQQSPRAYFQEVKSQYSLPHSMSTNNDSTVNPVKPTSVHSQSVEMPAQQQVKHEEPNQESQPTSLKRPLSSSEPDSNTRKNKRVKRWTEVPLFAQMCKAHPPLKKYQGIKDEVEQQKSTAILTRDPAQDDFGPWEPSILNVIPHEEVTKSLCDFLFFNVVGVEAFGTGDAGSIPTNQGQLEIEAKLGTIIDRSTNERLHLPICTETVVSSQANVAFESSMSQGQHEKFNDFINDAARRSRLPANGNATNPPKSRIHIHYKHTREVDTFYDLPESEIPHLPPQIQQHLKKDAHKFKSKIRVTTDETTGEVIAKIIKIRINDLHIYSPSFSFDWRVSVNIELNWDGDLKALIAAQSHGMKEHARRKDRMSYRHLFCQIDLTQVHLSENGKTLNEPDTHELEVELASSEVRRQGSLLMAGKPNRYEELVKSFADNVRILARFKP